MLICSASCVISNSTDAGQQFNIHENCTKLYVPVVPLSSHYNTNQDYTNNWNQDVNAKLAGININQKFQHKRKSNI